MLGRRRPLARAAMVGGGAYVLGKRSAQGRADESDQGAQTDQPENQQAAAAPGTGITDDIVEQLERLERLKDEEVLTPDEFEEQKKKLLQST